MVGKGDDKDRMRYLVSPTSSPDLAPQSAAPSGPKAPRIPSEVPGAPSALVTAFPIAPGSSDLGVAFGPLATSGSACDAAVNGEGNRQAPSANDLRGTLFVREEAQHAVSSLGFGGCQLPGRCGEQQSAVESSCLGPCCDASGRGSGACAF